MSDPIAKLWPRAPFPHADQDKRRSQYIGLRKAYAQKEEDGRSRPLIDLARLLFAPAAMKSLMQQRQTRLTSDELIDVVLQRFLTAGPWFRCDPICKDTFSDRGQIAV